MMTVKPIKFGTGRQLTDLAFAQTLADFFSHYNQVPHIKQKIETLQNVINQINNGYLPPQITDMTITEQDIALLQAHVLEKYPNNAERGNEYWEYLIEPLEALDELLASLRDELIRSFDMYSYPNEDFMVALDAYIGEWRVLELMAGQGYLTAGLRALNPHREIIATDNQAWLDQPGEHIPPVTDVLKQDAMHALEQQGRGVDVIIMSWAPDTETIDEQVLHWVRKYVPSAELLVIGEFNGATNSAPFWAEAQLTELEILNQRLKSFDLIDEKIYIAR